MRALRCGRDDLWGVLGLARGASREEARRAFMNTARVVHPDRPREPGVSELEATAAFPLVQEAAETLGSAELRAAYLAARSAAEYDGARAWARGEEARRNAAAAARMAREYEEATEARRQRDEASAARRERAEARRDERRATGEWHRERSNAHDARSAEGQATRDESQRRGANARRNARAWRKRQQQA